MGAPLVDRRFEDRLRAMELRLDAMERRTPVGDAVAWVPALTPAGSFPAHSLTAEYVRTNSQLMGWMTVTFSAAGSASSYGVNFIPPFQVEAVLGQWTVQKRYFTGTYYPVAAGPISQDTLDATRLQLANAKAGEDPMFEVTDGHYNVLDLAASISAGSAQYNTYNWVATDRIVATFTARVPDGW